MGMGNLESVLEALRRRPALLRRALLRLDADCATRRPTRGSRRFGDDSSNYYWKLGGGDARSCGWRARHGPAEPARGAADRRRLRPPVLLDGAPQGDLRALPADAADTALTAARPCGCGPRRSASRSTSAAAGAAISNAPALRVTGADDGGWTFRVSRKYASDDQALAFQYVLDRLQVLNVIAWSRTARSIRVTASRDAKVLEPLLDRLGANDRRHPHPRRPARRAARASTGRRASASGTGCGSRTSTSATASPVRDAPRRADLELPVAQGRPAGARGRPPRDPARPARLRALGQADGRGLVLLRPPHGGDRRAARGRSTCATRRSSCTTGAARSGCGSRSSTPSASRGWC